MSKRKLRATVPGTAADAVRRLADEPTFAPHAPDIVSIEQTGPGEHRWVVAFRTGVAQWVQESAVHVSGLDGDDRAGKARPHHVRGESTYRIEFEQTDGDFQEYGGTWTATDGPDGCEVEYVVRYRTSVPHFAGAIDSAIGRVLVRTALSVLNGLFGSATVTSGGHFLRDLPEGSPSHAIR
jgi:hypothetical protein